MNDAGTAHLAWLAQVHEDALDPQLPICDAHHHLWLDTGHTGWPYTLDDLHADTGTGHNVVRTVFLECGAEYRTDGPEHLRSVGETEFVAAQAERSAASGQAEIAAIVSTADPQHPRFDEALDAHEAAGGGRFRGIRAIVAHDDDERLAMGKGHAMLAEDSFRAGIRRLGERGYSFDTMVYHPQLPELAAAARACEGTTIVCNHLGAPLGVGPYRDRRSEVLAQWRASMAELAGCPNVVLKLGGIGMPMYGLRWDRDPKPPTSEQLAAPWQDEIRFCIDAFGPSRCFFESNFPVDKRCVSYAVLWNTFKRIAEPYSAEERRDLFHDSAARAYRITTIA
ncbi:MAG: amidohydrolase family protein [Acidimicrobiales bacterium]|nr:amidohydrolase family protein [Acidimicrobiales bacterium]